MCWQCKDFILYKLKVVENHPKLIKNLLMFWIWTETKESWFDLKNDDNVWVSHYPTSLGKESKNSFQVRYFTRKNSINESCILTIERTVLWSVKTSLFFEETTEEIVVKISKSFVLLLTIIHAKCISLPLQLTQKGRRTLQKPSFHFQRERDCRRSVTSSRFLF